MKTIKVRKWEDVPENFTGIAVNIFGTKYWFKNGKLHREDGPACEYTDGSKYWWFEDKPYEQINLKAHIVLDHYQGEYNLVWYKLLGKDKVLEYPDIPGLIIK